MQHAVVERLDALALIARRLSALIAADAHGRLPGMLVARTAVAADEACRRMDDLLAVLAEVGSCQPGDDGC